MSPSSSASRTMTVEVHQEGPSTGRGFVRTHSICVDRPIEKGGADQGPMGGELLLVALGGCFLSNLLAAIRARESAVDAVRVSVEARLEGVPERMTRFVLRVEARYDDAELMRKLLTIAERGCIVSNTLRGVAPIEIELTSARTHSM